MTTLPQLAQELIEKAKAATPGKWQKNHNCRIGISVNKDVYIPIGYTTKYEDAEYIAAVNPDAITVLCQAYLEAEKLIRYYADNKIFSELWYDLGADGEETERIDESQRANDWLEKYGGEG